MKKFNKNKALNKFNNRNNSNIKIISISISIFILIGAIIYFSFARFEKVTTYSLIDGTFTLPATPIVEKMTTLAAEGKRYLEYDGTDTLGENGTSDNNLRYVGGDPSNYIYFNCTTTNPSEMNNTTCEKWRIIGLFNNIEDENGNKASRVKIIREKRIGGYSWDSSDESINTGWGINQWGPSTYEDGTPYEGADIMRELNTDYLGNITVGTDGYWYGSQNKKQTAMPTSTLNENTQKMIATVKWNTGSNGSNGVSTWTTKNMYNYERSENTGKICNSGDNCNDTVIRTTSWIGKVALMYPSDYGYSTKGGSTTNKETCLNTSLNSWGGSNVEDCKKNSWIYESGTDKYTLTPFAVSNLSRLVFFTNYDGSIKYSTLYILSVNPVVYLTSDIGIVSGDGSSEKPYKLVQQTNLVKKISTLAANKASGIDYDGVDTLGEYGTPDNNIRYVGANPNNYVYYNCSTTDSSQMNDSTCEKWRIIGLFNNIEDDNGNSASRVKIMRDESIGDYPRDTSNSSVNNEYGVDQWGESVYEDGTPYEGADLMRELNTDYLGNITVGTEGYWYGGSDDDSKTLAMPTTSLNTNAQRMIQTVKWNTGASGDYDYLTYKIYNYERSLNDIKKCYLREEYYEDGGESLYCDDTIIRTTTWVGKIALMYLSDYGYATTGGSTKSKEECLNMELYSWTNNDCKKNSWIYNENLDQEVFTYYGGSAHWHPCIASNGRVFDIASRIEAGIRPTLYLKNSINVVDGDGSSSNPYKLVLK